MTFNKHLYRALAFGLGHVTALKYCLIIIIIIKTLSLSSMRVVHLLSVELFILGVQANQLHFCNLELILNKTEYSHIMENKNKNFHYLTS